MRFERIVTVAAVVLIAVGFVIDVGRRGALVSEHMGRLERYDRQNMLFDREESFREAYEATLRLIADSTDTFRSNNLSTSELCFIPDCTMDRIAPFVDRMRSKSEDGKTLYGHDIEEVSRQLGGEIRHLAAMVPRKESRHVVESAMMSYGVSEDGIRPSYPRVRPASAGRIETIDLD